MSMIKVELPVLTALLLLALVAGSLPGGRDEPPLPAAAAADASVETAVFAVG